ncbi:MAG TPA: hypothetical protein VMM36_19095 [Opitutaceae bacterium]|nr:hypothetical protein [Opitutaceae bacterium]
MTLSIDRRKFLHASTALAVGGLFFHGKLIAQGTPAASQAPPNNPPPKPPAVSPEDVQATVGVAHRSIEDLKKLVDATPLLANACWDWGGGDFETPLQAAAHTGGREIALYLLSKGARQDIFAAAMLGQLDFVKAAHAVDPRAHEIPGPHGFTLLHCAKSGAEKSQNVVDWLLASGVPDVTFRPLPYAWPEGATPA